MKLEMHSTGVNYWPNSWKAQKRNTCWLPYRSDFSSNVEISPYELYEKTEAEEENVQVELLTLKIL